MKTVRLLAIAAVAAVAFAGVNCAPVDDPGAKETKAAPPPTPPAAPMPPPAPTAGADGLKGRIDAAIDQVKQRELLTTNGFWTVFHGILGLGPSVELHDPDDPQLVRKPHSVLGASTAGLAASPINQGPYLAALALFSANPVHNALDYIAAGGPIRGVHFVPTPDGLDVETQAGSFVGQGHQDQFVAEMVEWNVDPNRVFMVNGKKHHFIEFINESRARASVKDNQELDWAVPIIGQYTRTDAEWTNRAGDVLRLEDLLRKELDQPLDAAACGGTHRLFGMTWVYHKHLSEGGKTDGVWKEIADKIAQYKEKARLMQNADGSFSTNFFRGPGDAPDIQLRINTTGHILEWLSLASTDEELQQPWVRDAANSLSLMILDNEGIALEGGSVYHAVHGLLLYRARVFGADDLGPMAPHLPPWPQAKKPA